VYIDTYQLIYHFCFPKEDTQKCKGCKSNGKFHEAQCRTKLFEQST